jgi:hypothetical protein
VGSDLLIHFLLLAVSWPGDRHIGGDVHRPGKPTGAFFSSVMTWVPPVSAKTPAGTQSAAQMSSGKRYRKFPMQRKGAADLYFYITESI